MPEHTDPVTTLSMATKYLEQKRATAPLAPYVVLHAGVLFISSRNTDIIVHADQKLCPKGQKKKQRLAASYLLENGRRSAWDHLPSCVMVHHRKIIGWSRPRDRLSSAILQPCDEPFPSEPLELSKRGPRRRYLAPAPCKYP